MVWKSIIFTFCLINSGHIYGCSNVAKLSLKKIIFLRKSMYDFYKIFFFKKKRYLFKINTCIPFQKV